MYQQVYALEPSSTLKLYHHLFKSMSKNRSVTVYVKDKEYQNIFSKSKYIKLVLQPEKADIVLITTETMLYSLKDNQFSKNTIVLTNQYRHLEKRDDIVGAFYYRKGRRQFLFLKPRLKEHNITLPYEYNKYIVDEL